MKSTTTTLVTLFSLSAPLLYFGKKYFEGGQCKFKRDLSDEIVVITGASAGIGQETVRSIADSNATVIIFTIFYVSPSFSFSLLKYIHIIINGRDDIIAIYY